MGGLGNGRRGGRSPPLMIGALIACIVVLGFNYWVSSSRNLELQTKLYELEGQVRRGAAEHGAAEMRGNEFQQEIQRQKEQISRIENLCKRQLEGGQNICSQEKGALQKNISSSAKTIQEFKSQLNQLNDDLGKLQMGLKSCEGNIITLNNKLTYDMTHCHSQVLSQKELCDERVAAAKLEAKKKMDVVLPADVPQENTVIAAVKEEEPVVTGTDSLKVATVVSHTPSISQPKGNEPPELLTNEIAVDKDPGTPVALPPAKDLSQKDSVPSTVALEPEVPLQAEVVDKTKAAEAEPRKLLIKNLTEMEEMEEMDAHEEGTQTEEADPGMEGMLLGQGKGDETLIGQKLQGPDDYDKDGAGNLDKQRQQKQAENIDKDMEEELADYNGDDENEGEFEADKQAELARV